jgi:hypothetical protein
MDTILKTLRVKTIAVSVRLWIYLCALKYTNNMMSHIVQVALNLKLVYGLDHGWDGPI